MITRQQGYMARALRHVNEIHRLGDTDISDDYLQLCHNIPVLVLNNGLERTARYIDDKARSDDTYSLIRNHLIDLLGGQQQSLATVVTANNAIMRHTTTVLDAWVYYKRFAMSILDTSQEG